MPWLQKVTGWQSRSIRAALTGLRRKCHTIERSKSAKGDTVYRIIAGDNRRGVFKKNRAAALVEWRPLAT